MIRPRISAVSGTLAARLPRRAALARLAGGAAALAGGVGVNGFGRERVAAQSTTPHPDASAFVVIRRYQLRPDASMDALVERVNTGFVPIVQGISGFREYLFVDAGNGAHLTMSFYDDPTGAEESTKDAAAWAAENVASMIEGPPEVTEGWVRIHIDAAAAGDATPAA